MPETQKEEPSITSAEIHFNTQAASNDAKVSPNVSVKDLPARSATTASQNAVAQMPQTIHKRSFTQGLLSISWLVHVISVGATIAIVQLSFRDVYWFDEKTSAVSWYKYSIDEQTGKKALQFVAKIHEALIVSSLSAMILHIVRRMLIGHGPGLSFALLAGAYRLGSIPWLFSTGFWSPLKNSKSYRNRLFALCLGLAFVYANLVGPSSAIAIIPTLDWWPVPNPYGDEKLTTYITAPRDSIFPTELTKSTHNYTNCTVSNFLCPGGGFSELYALISAYDIGGIETETQIKQPVAETYRILNSSLDYADNSHIAVATTQHSSISALVGAFWNHIKKNETTLVNHIRRPRFQPADANVFAPLVQVQCSRFSRRDADDGQVVPVFSSSGMRNFSGLLDYKRLDYYQDRSEWDLDKSYWKKPTDTRTTTFEWLDLASLFPKGRPSLGAVATVPVAISETLKNKTTIGYQDSYIIPCMIDARWAGVSMTFDPGLDTSLGLVPSNLTDLSKLEPFWDPKSHKSRLGGLTSRNIPISPEWAELLNLNVTAGEVENKTAIQELLEIFVYDGISLTNNESITFFKSPWDNKTGPSFDDPSYNLSNFDYEMNDIARTVATILSLVVADGMSRVSYLSNLGVVLKDHKNGTVLWKDLYYQTGQARTEPGNELSSALDDLVPIVWEVSRYGWGYGLKGAAVYFGITMLLVHVLLVIAYAIYIVWFRTRRPRVGWASTAWDTLQELLAFSLISPVPVENTGKVRDVAEGKADGATLAKTARVRKQDGQGLVLVLEE
ncbi:short-chain dehydrogenase [Fusarium albosuccineum]|uniref:Short-chain dehydrogenase n=1 Tax=Fusarium albosuccineum TaxID=1237068 RepID=A0A8H4L515_9HYPO|nr:short-chain dehydrogenase [Fusarium albosuccineum]